MSSSSLIGRKLGKFEIVELLGKGGMATVYKGYQADVDRHVAVKVLPPHPGQDPEFIDRFQLEARTIARLQHPHILPLYDYGVEDNILYLVMQYVNAGSLSNRIDRGAMPLTEIEELLKQIASALDYAHRQGVIHRDIKPENILLDSEGHALLADFGIVKLVGGDTNITGTGSLVGTPAYMAPELGRGLPAGHAADIYSLGIVVYEMLTGTQPYTADTPLQVVLKHVNDPIPDVGVIRKNLPSAINGVIRRALAKDPQSRYATALNFAEDFARAVRGSETVYTLADVPAISGQPTTGTPTQPFSHGSTESVAGQQSATPIPTINVQTGDNRVVLLAGAAIIALLVVIIALLMSSNDSNSGGVVVVPTSEPTTVAASPTPRAVALAPSVPTFGHLSFSTAAALGDTVNLSVEGLQRPAQGMLYEVWLQNTASGDWLTIGELTVNAFGGGVLAFTDEEGRPLPTLYNAVVITEQTEMSDSPVGDTIYSASVPPALTQALSEIFVASENGLNGGSLLAGALAEAGTGLAHANNAFNSANRDSLGGVHTHAEHMVNIYHGSSEDLDGNGRGENPGRGVGVPHFLNLIEEQINAVASSPEATLRLQQQAELIFPCLDNTRLRVDEITALARQLVTAPDVATALPMSENAVALATAIIEGHDLNQSNGVEAFEGECGLEQIETFGILVGSMSIVEGALPESNE